MPPGIGDPAPPFSGQDVLTGEQFSLADHQGSVVLVAFNGLTWCGPCQFEAPVLQSLSEEHKLGVQFVMVAVGCEASALTSAVQTLGLTMPVINDAGDIANEYGITFVPKLFVLKTDLTICAIKDGAGGTTDALSGEIAELLQHCGAPTPIPPVPVHELLAVAHILFGVVQDGGGLVWPGGKVPPWNPLRRLAPETRNALIALAVQQLAGRIDDRRVSSDLQRTAVLGAQSALAALEKRVEFESGLTQDRMPVRR
jgi:thiol-disulfide isomerase/thioredoxin